MYYLTNKYEPMNSRRCFDDLKLLIRTILIDNEIEAIKYIDSDMQSEPISSIEVPYAGILTIGEIVVNWAKQNDKWDEVVWHIAERIEEEMLDAFADCWMDGGKKSFIFNNYAITRD